MSKTNTKSVSVPALGTALAAAAAVEQQQAEQAATETAATEATQPQEQAAQASAPAQESNGVKDEAPKAAEVASQDLISGSIAAGAPEKPVQAAAKTETPEPEVKQAPVASVVGATGKVETVAGAQSTSAFSEKLQKILQGLSPAEYNDITRVKLYCETMNGRFTVDERVGMAEQISLYRCIQNIINRNPVHFEKLFTALLAIFEEEANGALSDRLRNRFMQNIALGKADRTAFTSLTHLLYITAKPSTRAFALRQIDITRALANGLSAEGASRVMAYYGV